MRDQGFFFADDPRYPCKGLWWLDVFRKHVTVDGRNPASPGNNVYRYDVRNEMRLRIIFVRC